MAKNALSYAVRPGVVLRFLGQLCLVAAALALVPLTFSLVWGDYYVSLCYTAVASVLAVFGAISSRLPAPREVQRNEALVVSAGMFVITSLAMIAPMMGSGLDFFDAWFESTSAVTTTGLSTTGTVADDPLPLMFGRAWMQWYGGLGIVVLSLGLAMQPGPVARRLALTQSDESDIIGSTRAHARRMFFLYGGLTGAAIFALWILGLWWFGAVVHGFTAVSTGGFSLHDDSLASLPLAVQIAVIVIAVACSVSLPLYWLSGPHPLRRLLTDRQLWTLLLCGFMATTLLFIFLATREAMPWPDALRHAALNAFSAQSTAGFSTVNIADLDDSSKVTLIVAMAIGGSATSTAGGFKVLRLLVVLHTLQRVFFRTTQPRDAIDSPRLVGQQFGPEEREGAFCIVALFFITVLLSWLPFVWVGFDPLDSLFEVVSATGTVGLSAGIASPDLPAPLKAVLCFDMLLGRVEFVALLVILYPRTWLGRRMRSS